MNDINLFALLAGALCIAAGLMLGLLLSRRQQKLQEGRITALEEELQSLNQRLTAASQEREQLQARLNAALQQKAVAESSLSDVSQRLAHSEQQRSDADRAKADAQAALPARRVTTAICRNPQASRSPC